MTANVPERGTTTQPAALSPALELQQCLPSPTDACASSQAFNPQSGRLLQYGNRGDLHGRVSNDVNSFGLPKLSAKRTMRRC
jgi:hypothetical protein